MVDRLAGLDQGEDLEHLVERPVAARQGDDRGRVADEHQLAGEEVVEGEPDVAVGVQVLLERQQDVEPDRGHPRLLGAAVGGLHQPRSAAGDHREPGLADRPAELVGLRVQRVALGGAGRAEHADRRPEPGERLEALAQLALDQVEPLRVGAGRGDVRRFGADDLGVRRERFGRLRVFHCSVSFASEAATTLASSHGSVRKTTALPRSARRRRRPSGAGREPARDRAADVDDARAAELVRERRRGAAAGRRPCRKAIEIGARVLEQRGDGGQRRLRASRVRAPAPASSRAARRGARVGRRGSSPSGSRAASTASATTRSRSRSTRSSRRRCASSARRSRGCFRRGHRQPADRLQGPVVQKASRRSRSATAPRSRAARIASGSRRCERRAGRAPGDGACDKDGRAGSPRRRPSAGPRRGAASRSCVHATIEQHRRRPGRRRHSHRRHGATRAGSKKGDTLVEIGGAPGSRWRRSSSRPRTSGSPRTTRGPSSTRAWRSATRSFAVLVVAGEDNVPSGLEELTEYQGNKMIVACSTATSPSRSRCALVYRLVRAAGARDGADRELEVDAVAVRDAAAEAIGPAQAAPGGPHVADRRSPDQRRQGRARRARRDGRRRGGVPRPDRRRWSPKRRPRPRRAPSRAGRARSASSRARGRRRAP